MSISLMEALLDVPDPRSKHGIRHPLGSILSLIVLAQLQGFGTLDAIVQFGREHGPSLAHPLGFRRGKTPAKSTLSVLLRSIDPRAFELALCRWICPRVPEDDVVLSLDGKAIRGSRDGEIPGQHLVALYAHHSEAVLGQLRVDAKTNEHKAALELIGILPLHGRVIVADAMFCQRDFCEKVIQNGGDYVLTVKDNQPALLADVAAGFAYQDSSFSPSEDILHLFAFKS